MTDKNDNYDLNFNDKYEDVMSNSKSKGGKREYEDISSFSRKKKKTKKSAKKRWMTALKVSLISLTTLFMAIVLLLVYVRKRFDYNYDSQFHVNVQQKDENIINVALFGVDSRDIDDFTGLTDSIMILSINQKTDTIKIISVMRDTFVPLKDENDEFAGYGKINSAYASGGDDVTKSATIAVNTLNSVYDLDISNYAVVNFFGMIDIIDAMGGITATITDDELAWKGEGNPNLNNCMDEICREKGLKARDYYITKSGEQTLNGVQAVAYARVRHCTSTWGTKNDYGRTDRQRHVMQQLFNKAIKLEKSKYVGLIDALIPCSQTSLSPANILDLAVSVLLQKPSFEQYRLPPEGYVSQMQMTPPFNESEYKRYGSVVYYDLDYAAKMMNAIIFDNATVDEFIESNPIERNHWFKSAGPQTPPAVEPDTPDEPVETPDDKPVTDTDGDGIPDAEDPDDDGDGILDEDETPDEPVETPDDKPVTDTDGDGIPDAEDPDDDGDGILDEDEVEDDKPDDKPVETPDDKPVTDTDGDGIPDAEDTDADGDGILDDEQSTEGGATDEDNTPPASDTVTQQRRNKRR